MTGLPKYDPDGNAWIYYVTETAIQDAGGADLSGSYGKAYRDRNGYAVQSALAHSGGSVTNTLSAGGLTLRKTVSGNLGDRTRDFHYTVTLINPDSSPYTGQAAAVYTRRDGSTEIGTLTFTGGSADVSLKHGESVALSHLPGTLSNTITETDAAGYETACAVNGGAAVTGASTSGGLSQDGDIICTNARQAVVPTGVRFEPGLFAAALPLAALGMLRLLRRGKEEKSTE